MKMQSSTNSRRYLVGAGALFGALAAYTFFHNSHDWPQAILWAAIGAAFVTIGLARKIR